MKTQLQSLFLGMALLAGVYQAAAQIPFITSFSQNGVLVCSNLQPGTIAGVEWASSLAGPWQTNWSVLEAVMVSNNGTIRASVPMFYRVRAAEPTGMALIPAGTFTMGDTLDVTGMPLPMSVTVSAFYMDTNLVRWSQWQTVYSYATGNGYSFSSYSRSGKAANHPVQVVNWYDCVKWCNARSAQAGLTPVYYTDAGFTQVYKTGEPATVYQNMGKNGYRLPTEAEWEKAARGGLSGQRFPWGNTISESQANYKAFPNPPNSAGYAYDLGPYTGYNTNYNTGGYPYTSPVGSFAPNGYGLYDMTGNVQEWCWDWYATQYGQPTTNNPTGPAGPLSYRVMRSGHWDAFADYSRCAMRFINSPSLANDHIGFRCVRVH